MEGKKNFSIHNKSTMLSGAFFTKTVNSLSDNNHVYCLVPSRNKQEKEKTLIIFYSIFVILKDVCSVHSITSLVSIEKRV